MPLPVVSAKISRPRSQSRNRRNLRFSPCLLLLGMAQSPLTSPDVWNELYQDYDRTIVPLFSIAARRGVELVAPDQSFRVLDVACGPGTLTLAVAPRVRQVVAVDFATSMIELLQNKCRQAGIRNVDARVADGTELPFADSEFDATFSCFGLFLFADRAKGLSELFRVGKTKSRTMISSWAPVEGPIEAMYRIVREVLPDLPFQKGSAPLGTREEIEQELAAAGFIDLQIEPVRIPFSFESAQDFWAENSRASAPLVATRRRVPPSEWPAIETRILETIHQAFPGRMDFDRFAWVAVGTKPAG
jgi:SAM-dependent methyltransferase